MRTPASEAGIRPPDLEPIRVVFVISNLEYGGAQRQVVELANRMDPRRFEVRVCSLSPYVPLARDLHDPARLTIVRKRFKFDVTVVPRLARLLRAWRADVVQGYLFDAEIAARLAGRQARTPLVAGTERNTDYRLKRRQLVAFRLTRSAVDLMVANSHAGAAFNARLLGHPPSLYRVVHNGVDVDRFRPRAAGPVRTELGIAPDEHVVGMFASFKEQKNHPLFFAAAQRILQEVPRARFLLVGDQLHGGLHGSDDYKRRIERLVDGSGLRARCLFLGNRDDVERLYPACHLTVLPSRFEGTPNTLLESMASGVPIVATRVSDNALIVPDGRCGYLVELGDEAGLAERVVRLLRDADARCTFGHAARRWVEERFSMDGAARRLEAVLRDALGAAADRAPGAAQEPRAVAGH